MANCSRCGKSIASKYVVCHDCYQTNAYTTRKGYPKFRDTGEYVHREIAATKAKRDLRPGKVIHHKNGNTKDNRPSNLQILPNQAAHARLHNTEGKRKKKRTGFLGGLVS